MSTLQREFDRVDGLNVILQRFVKLVELFFGLLGRENRQSIRCFTHFRKSITQGICLALAQQIKRQTEFKQAICNFLTLSHQGRCLGRNIAHLIIQPVHVAMNLIKNIIVWRFDQVACHGSFGFGKPSLEAILLLWGHGRLGRHGSHHGGGRRARHGLRQDHRSLGIFGGLKADIVGSQKCFQTRGIRQFRMDRDTTQESFQIHTSIFDKGRVESPDRLLFRNGRNNGSSTLYMQAFVKPQKIGISA
mmetsp:Transcript_9247/g.20834  ORF Transcript_9247/g.20834 Transcript_9247/m.20834 type:complete len:247 (+) Transcript_9247:661-1401(+)